MRPIAFDIGNVLVELDFTPFENCWRQYNLHLQENYMDFLLDLHGQQDVGLTTLNRHVKERFGHLPELHHYGLNVVLFDLNHAWNKCIVPNEIMIGYMNDLQETGHPVALWSNMGKEHSEFIAEAYPEIFKDKIMHLSCDVGARKPTKLYYQSFLLNHPEFKDCVYLDDLPKNIVCAKEYGITAVHFELNKELKNETLLRSLQKINNLLAIY